MNNTSGFQEVNPEQRGIAPYKYLFQKENEPASIFEDTVVLMRDNNNQLTRAQPVKGKRKQKAPPSYMQHTKSSRKKFSLK